eukprot:gene26993-biopygen6186
MREIIVSFLLCSLAFGAKIPHNTWHWDSNGLPAGYFMGPELFCLTMSGIGLEFEAMMPQIIVRFHHPDLGVSWPTIVIQHLPESTRFCYKSTDWKHSTVHMPCIRQVGPHLGAKNAKNGVF